MSSNAPSWRGVTRAAGTVLAALVHTAVASPPLAAQPSPLEHRLDSLFARADSPHSPGCGVGVLRPGRPPLSRYYGLANLEQRALIDSETVFEAGSVSKQVTAAAVLLLAHDKRLSLADPVRKWIPELSPLLPNFTVAEMLHHVAGLRDYGDLVELTGWPRTTRLYDVDDVLGVIAAQRRLNFAPRSEYSYSNSGYVLATIVVARASGVSFSEYTSRSIFTPLGMQHTSWRDDVSRIVPHRAQGYTPNDSGGWTLDMPYENTVGNGGLLTTVPDLLRWQSRLLSDVATSAGGAFAATGGPNFVREMEATIALRSGRVVPYGLGLEIGEQSGERVVSHAGWTAGYKAYVGRLTERGVAVALLCNGGTLNSEALGPVLLAIAGELPLPADDAVPALGVARDSADTGVLSALAGSYRNERTQQRVQVRAFMNGITVNTWTGYRPLNDSTLVSIDGRRTMRLLRGQSGHVRGYELVVEGDTVAYTRVAAWAPSRLDRTLLIGRYRCSEVDADVDIIAARDEQKSLQVVRRGRLRDTLKPLYRDAFDVENQGWLLTVQRDRTGAVESVQFSSTRTRRVPCVRVRKAT